MPSKVCTNCHAPYWARWRNERHTLCPECLTASQLCVACYAVRGRLPDPAQLALWIETPPDPRTQWNWPAPSWPDEHYQTYTPARATNAERKRYPYH
jgi:hypothetical protein